MWKWLQKMYFCFCMLDKYSFCKLILFGKIKWSPVGLWNMPIGPWAGWAGVSAFTKQFAWTQLCILGSWGNGWDQDLGPYWSQHGSSGSSSSTDGEYGPREEEGLLIGVAWEPTVGNQLTCPSPEIIFVGAAQILTSWIEHCDRNCCHSGSISCQ